MKRRRFIHLLGVGAAATVVTSQLPGSAPTPIAVTSIPAIPALEPEPALEYAVEEECVAMEDRPNPYIVTKFDVGLIDRPNLNARFKRYTTH